MMYEALQQRDKINRLYLSRKEGRALASSEDSVDVSIRELEDYIKKSKGRRIAATPNSSDNIRTNITLMTKKEKFEEK